ncbi:MAG TPA: DUF6797 domain-containing protein, partial [Verrucomicrobiae bacterium]|nr:DUF6797 domain-containing protein [Verrucomicrobiae bacterium]
MKSFCLGLCSLLFFQAMTSGAENQPLVSGARQWGDFIETNFPFFSSVLDARDLGKGFPTNNLTPRGVILNLGNDCWACFDVDLLRVSAIWQGKGVTPVSMSQISYHDPGTKAQEGQTVLPRIIGTPWIATGIYPGWQTGEEELLADPREPGLDPREVGRGPLPASVGRFKAVRLTKAGAVLDYEVAGTSVSESITSAIHEGEFVVTRRFHLDEHARPLRLLLGNDAPPGQKSPGFSSITQPESGGPGLLTAIKGPGGAWVVSVPSATTPTEFSVRIASIAKVAVPRSESRFDHITASAPARWPQVLTTHGTLSPATNSFVVDNIRLPNDNPWHRNIRLADIAFFRDGRAAAVTFDGDVWMISGLRGDLREVKWRRFTSGLHEPLSLCIRNEEIFVFDRNGIWRLKDTNGDDEADVHELFSNAFTQTAETREFATGIRPAPDGSFVISKGGIQMTTLGKHNGSVLRVSPDGQSVEVLGTGLREPFIGVNPETGMVTASDQQGHYVPTTPLHIIRDQQFHGFLSVLQPKGQYPAPIAEPLTWIPYPVNASGAGQVWLAGAKMGALNGALIHLGYYRPEVFAVRLNQRGSKPQAAVLSVTRDLEFAPLHGAVNPADGQLYVAGF